MFILMENQTTCHKVYLNMKNVVIFAGCKMVVCTIFYIWELPLCRYL